MKCDNCNAEDSLDLKMSWSVPISPTGTALPPDSNVEEPSSMVVECRRCGVTPDARIDWDAKEGLHRVTMGAD